MKAPILLLCILVASTALGGCLGIEAKSSDGPMTPKVPVNPANESVPVNYTAVKALIGALPCQANGVTLTENSGNVKHVRTLAPYVSPGLGVRLGYYAGGEIDANPNGTVFSSVRRTGTPPTRGYDTFNVSDPTKAKGEGFGYSVGNSGGNLLDPYILLAYTRLLVPQTLDIRYSTNGQAALIATEDRVSAVDTTKPLQPRRPDGGRGYYYYNYPPEIMMPSGFGEAHKIAILHIGDYDYFFVAPGASGSGILVGRILGTSNFARPELVRVFPTGEGALDLFAVRDPYSGEALLYAANGPKGFTVYNIDDPAAPVLRIRITPPTETVGPELKPAVYSSIQAGWVQGRRIVAVAGEAGSGEIRVFNLTQFNKPQLLGVWSADGKLGTPNFKLQILNGTLLAAAGPLGIIGFDLTKTLEGTGAPMTPSLHYQPPNGAPIQDVVVRYGLLFAGDALQNIHIAAFGCYPVGEPKFATTG